MHSKPLGEAVLGPDEEVVAGGLVQLLLPQGQQPGLTLEGTAQGGGEGAQAVHAVLVGQHVLGHLVHHDEQRGPLAAEAQHVPDGGHGLLGGLGPGVGAGAAGIPTHGIGVPLGEHLAHHQREVLLGHGPVLDRVPGLAQGLLGRLQKARPLAVALQA